MREKIYIALDPGSEQTGWVCCNFSNSSLVYKNKEDNLKVYEKISLFNQKYEIVKIFCEYPSSYGMPVNQTLIDTSTFIGIIIGLAKNLNIPIRLCFRQSVKMALCYSTRAKDASVSSRLREIFGEDNTIKVPNKYFYNEVLEENGGAKYMNGDIWASLGVLYFGLMEKENISEVLSEKEKERKKISIELQKFLS